MYMEFNGGNVRTVFIFLNLVKHIEYKVQEMPLLQEGTILEFDMKIKDFKKIKEIKGSFIVKNRILRYSTSRPGYTGLTQYLEFEPHTQL